MAEPNVGAAPRRRSHLKTQLEEYERTLILRAVLAAGGNQRRAAAMLGVLPTTLCEKIKRLGMREALQARFGPDAGRGPDRPIAV